LEFQLVARAGLDFGAVLASLATTPAIRFAGARPELRARYTIVAGRFTYGR
jgi:hypothetical protein